MGNMIAILAACMAALSGGEANRPTDDAPAPKTRTAIIRPAEARDLMAVVPRYPIPDPRRYPGKVVNGVQFHYVPVMNRNEVRRAR